MLTFLTLAFITLLFLVSAHVAWLAAFDAHIAASMAATHTPLLDRIMLTLTTLGDPAQAAFIFLIGSLILAAHKKKHDWYVFTIAAGIGISMSEFLKITIARVRPASTLLAESGYSFPSAHATIATIFLFSALLLFLPLIKNKSMKIITAIFSVLLFSLIAASRMYLSVHFASDVIGGILVGCIAYIFADHVTRHWHHPLA